MKPHAAVDFESFYDKKTLSASTHGPWKYLHSTDIYLVSIVTEDGFEWVGDPKQAPWDRIAGHTWVSHNRSFDATAAKALGIDHPDWHCSADLCAYFQYPRSLAGATAALYNEVVSKQVRDEMDGVRWSDVTDKQAVLDYALIDSRKCLRLWLDHGPKWPEKERALSQHTTQMGHRGIGLDLPLLAAGIETLRQQLHEIRKSIPWEGKPTSPKELAAECRRIGIEPPVTTAVKNPRFDAWLRENEEKAPFVRGISLYRSTNRLLNGLETMDRFRDGDRLRVPLRYCGAPHTGRWSGKASDRDDDASFNLQNLLKKDLFGVNQRHLLIPKPGNSFITLDLSQIEPRVLSWLAGNKKMLDFFRAGYDAYEAAARSTKGYTDPRPLKQVDPALRQRCKIETLGLGYRMGWSKLKSQAEGFGMRLTEWGARGIVDEYRRQNPGVVRLWERFDMGIVQGKEDGEMTVKLPSGRTIRYWDPRWNPTLSENGRPRGWEVRFSLGGPHYKVHGGICAENCCVGDAEILTEKRGWTRLDSVQISDRVWDGEEFVGHDGLIHKGFQKVLSIYGVGATEDHLFLGSRGWVPANCIDTTVPWSSSILHATRSIPSGNSVRTSHGRSSVGCHQQQDLVGASVRLWETVHSPKQRADPNPIRRPVCLLEILSGVPRKDLQGSPNSRHVEAPILPRVALNDRPVQTSYPPVLEELRWPWNHRVPGMDGLRNVFPGHVPDVPTGTRLGPDRQQRGVLQGELSVGYSKNKRSEFSSGAYPGLGFGRLRQERGASESHVLPDTHGVASRTSVHPETRFAQVFDLLNCGPRHRFAIRGGPGQPVLIAHNCTQAVAREVFADKILDIEKVGIEVVHHAHDELTAEVPDDRAEEALETMTRIMATTPDWIPGLPLASDGFIAKRYEKD